MSPQPAYPHKSRTICTKVKRSTALDCLQPFEKAGGPTRTRTWDQRIMSPLL